MITIEPLESYDKGLRVSGHAGYAERGKDIICSAVSMSVQMVGHKIHSMGYGKYTLFKEGEIIIEIFDEFREKAWTFMSMLIESLAMLQKQFPKYIQIKEEEHDKETWI